MKDFELRLIRSIRPDSKRHYSDAIVLKQCYMYRSTLDMLRTRNADELELGTSALIFIGNEDHRKFIVTSPDGTNYDAIVSHSAGFGVIMHAGAFMFTTDTYKLEQWQSKYLSKPVIAFDMSGIYTLGKDGKRKFTATKFVNKVWQAK